MGETLALVIKEAVARLVVLALCVADNYYPPMGSAVYYWTHRYSHSLKVGAKNAIGKTADFSRNALIRFGKVRSFLM